MERTIQPGCEASSAMRSVSSFASSMMSSYHSSGVRSETRRSTALIKLAGPAPIFSRARDTLWFSAAWAGTRMFSSWCTPMRSTMRVVVPTFSMGRSTQRLRIAS